MPDRTVLSKRAQREVILDVTSKQPTRARAVLGYVDAIEATISRMPPKTRATRRAEARSKAKGGHPARTTSKQRRRQWHDKPDEREQGARDLNRLTRKYRTRMDEKEGDVGPLLAAVAEFVVPQLLDDFDLTAEHDHPLRHWLMAKFGDVLRQPDIEGYLAWRESCRLAVKEASSDA